MTGRDDLPSLVWALPLHTQPRCHPLPREISDPTGLAGPQAPAKPQDVVGKAWGERARRLNRFGAMACDQTAFDGPGLGNFDAAALHGEATTSTECAARWNIEC